MKKYLFYIVALTAAACILDGCKKEELQEGSGPAPVITVREVEKVYPSEGGTFSLLYSIENPREGVEPELSSGESWISDFSAANRRISFSLSENPSFKSRKGNISFSYKGAEPVSVEITQAATDQSVITVKEPEVFGCEGGSGTIMYSIENPREGDELQATTGASWITGITVGSSDVSFKVSKNVDETSGRTAEILLTYGNAEPVKVTVSQQEYTKPVIEVPETVTLDAFDLKGSFTYSIRNPREGAQLKATSQHLSIKDVTVTGSEITFSILFNANSETRRASILLEYEDAQSVTVRVEQSGVAPIRLGGREAANCYIVPEPGVYFIPAVKGNTSESVGTIASAEVLWESFGSDVAPKAGDLIENAAYYLPSISTIGRIYFRVSTPKRGNAVIAAKDASGKILWSWHIWMTDQPEDQVYNNGAGTMMDRNLGATSATPGSVGALGLLYQWGRKDPFLGSSSISSNTRAKSTLSWPSPVKSTASTGTIDYAVSNPVTFITSNGSNTDWYYTGNSSTDSTRWRSSKTIYDPCPAGYRVPDGGDNGIWSKAFGTSSLFSDTSYDSTNEGINFGSSGKGTNKLSSSVSVCWYPFAGYLSYYDGSLSSVGSDGNYWPCSPSGSYLNLYGNGLVCPSCRLYRAYGCSVRCQRITY